MGKKTEIRVPDIGDFDKVPVIEVLVAEGDSIEAEQSLVTLESDKATMEVPSPAAGKLVKLSVSEGDEVSEGDVIGEMELDDDGSGEDTGGDGDSSDSPTRDRDAEEADSAPSGASGGGSKDGSKDGSKGDGDADGSAGGTSETIEIRVPDIGDFDKVPVIEVLVEKGDSVEAEQSLLTLESDKATMDIPAPEAGTLVELDVGVGDEVSEGDVIGRMKVARAARDEESEPPSDQGSGDESTSKASGSDDSKSTGSTTSGKPSSGASGPSDEELKPPPVPFAEMGRDPSSIPHASPAVRKLARELGVDLAGVKGSGAHGRITESDLKQHVKSAMQGGGRTAASSGSGLAVADAPKVDFSKFGEVEEKPLSRIQKISGPNLHRNWVSIPHVTQFDEADITEMDAFRKASKADAEEAGTKMTPLVFLIKAVVAGLQKYPKFNTSLSADGQSLVWKKYFHVGVAVDTPNGLMVPVIRDADRKSLLDLAHDLTDLSGKARDGKLSRDEMTGGCFSISSLGGIGGTAFTPIINAPEVAILGVSKAETKPVWNGETFEPRLMLPLSLSYDHRVIDGADAARFTRYLAHVLGDIRRLML